MTIPHNDEIEAVLAHLATLPRTSLSLDLSDWTDDDDPVGFIAEIRAMERFGCTVTVDGLRVELEGPAPVVAAITQSIAAAVEQAIADRVPALRVEE